LEEKSKILNLEEAKIYWSLRAKEQGIKYVGHIGHSNEEHKNFYWRKAKFLNELIPRHKRVLDFGCGVGMFSHLFDKGKYLGVDIIDSAINLTLPHYRYQLIENYSEIEGRFDLIFTANVLQHISDLGDVFKCFRKVMRKGHLLLMENYTDSGVHMYPRGGVEYCNIIENYFHIKSLKTEIFEGGNLAMKIKVK